MAASGSEQGDTHDIQAYVLTAASYSISRKQAFTVLHRQNVDVDSSTSLSKLCRIICHHTHSLQKGKWSLLRPSHQEGHHGSQYAENEARLKQIWNQWPQVVPTSLKDKIANMFHKETSSDALQQKICACCSESVMAYDCEVSPASHIDLLLLRHPDIVESQVDPITIENV
jgi:hypothetical protein